MNNYSDIFILDSFLKQTDFVVQEKSESYSSFVLPYLDRFDLTNEEKVEIGNYQDIWPFNIQKNNWSVPIPIDWVNKSWCYMINSACRSFSFYNSLTEDEKRIISDSISKMDSAIQKSKIRGERFIYRGVQDLNWLAQNKIKEKYKEEAFGSFSVKIENALKYTNPKNPILFQLLLKSDMNALFVDSSEYEILRPRNSVYEIRDIFIKSTSILNQELKITIYTIE